MQVIGFSIQLLLRLAAEHNCHSIVFPAISTGAYRFPVTEAARTALDTTYHFLAKETSVTLVRVRFVLYTQFYFDAFAAALEELPKT